MCLPIMRFVFFNIVLLFLFSANVIAEKLTVPDDKAVIQFETRLGTVTFAHKKHAGLCTTQCLQCTTCHHTLQPTDTRVKPCRECHQQKSKEPAKTKKAFHTRCTGCHEFTVAGGQHAGPLKKKCKLCHIKQPSLD